MLNKKLRKLTFGLGNSKLSNSIATLSLPAGYTCPQAYECLSKADRYNGVLKDGPHCKYRCYGASEECVFTSVRISRWNNFNLLKTTKTLEEMANLIQRSLPFGIGIIRVHPAGDFYNETYFLAWLNVALNNPFITFYGYTKCLSFLIKYKKDIPGNFRFTASKGGKQDHLINKHKLRYAEVVFSTEEARRKGLVIDHDDTEAIFGNKSFLLLLHGTQPLGTEASIALSQLKKQGLGTYNENNKTIRMEKPVKIKVNLKK